MWTKRHLDRDNTQANRPLSLVYLLVVGWSVGGGRSVQQAVRGRVHRSQETDGGQQQTVAGLAMERLLH